MTKTPLIPLAIDLGASKLLAYAGDSTPGYYRVAFQSAHLAPVGQASVLGDDGLAETATRPLIIESDNVPPLYVGDHAARWGTPVEGTDFERFSGTPETRALLYALLTVWQRDHGPFSAPLHLGLALPNQLLATAGPDEKHAIKSWPLGSHTWHADGQPYTATIEQVSLASQANAAIFDWSLDDQGRVLKSAAPHLEKEVAAISIGYRTGELAVLDNRQRVPRFTAGRDVGAMHLLRLIDPKGAYDMAELEPRLRRGQLDPAALARAIPVWKRKVDGFIDDVWGDAWQRFENIVIIGGGVVLLKDLPNRFGYRAFVPEKPTHAVARGLCKSLSAKPRRPA